MRLAIQNNQVRIYLKRTVIAFFGLLLCSVNFLHGQVYDFPEIKEIFLVERPQIGDAVLREDCFGSLDDLIIGTFPPLHSGTKGFYTFMVQKALLEIATEEVTEGATIWQIYNHGFVVKTPSVLFGCDLYDYFNIQPFRDLADILDACFVSHNHGDHYSYPLITDMKALGKPVVGTSDFSLASIKMEDGDSQVIVDLNVTAHYGLHSVPVCQFEIVTQEGLRFLHTGDNQTSETLPSITDIDVLLLNAWINESGGTSWIEGVRIAVNKLQPVVTLPGHIMELGHLSSYNAVPYRDPIASDNGTLASEYYVLAWGERYHYGASSNDTIPPYDVENPHYTIQDDTVTLAWDLPYPATDGDTASYYRLIVNDDEDYLVTNREYHYTDFTSELQSVKIYAYDDCGNQSLSYKVVPDLNDLVYITFEVTVPEFTPSGDDIYITGNFNQWDPGPSQNGIDALDHDLPMNSIGSNQWQIILPFTAGELIEYKYTRGGWNTVEKGAQGQEISNRSLTIPNSSTLQEDTVEKWADVQSSVEMRSDIPTSYHLSQNHPNPFNTSTTIAFSIPQTSFVTLTVYDIRGTEIAELFSEKYPPGRHVYNWEAENLPSGVYFYRIEMNSFTQTKKFILMK